MLSVLSSRPKSSYDITALHQDLMPVRNPSIEENTHRQRGAKLVFDGVELPSVCRISSRKTRYGGDKDTNRADENMEIENGSNSGATGSFPLGSHDNVTGTPTERNTTRGRGITKQRKGVTGNIPATKRDMELEQPFARESSFSRGTSPSLCTVG